MIPKECKRLAEVDFPIAEVSKHSAREKSIRHGHPSTLHLWWARRPLAACRAMLLELLLPDPCDENCPKDFKKKARDLLPRLIGKVGPKDEDLRKSLLKFIADFANWDNSSHPTFLEVGRGLVKAAHGEETPLVVDPFAGGGSIPLEALRLGCEAFASDLNPVACLILKVMLEDIPRHGPELAEKLRRVGKEIKEKAEKELAEFYPKDLDGAKPIAYLWARTVKCESPNCGAEIPLMRSFWLCKKANRKRALRYKIVRFKGEVPRVKFEIFEPKADNEVSGGTVTRAKATCLCCNMVLPPGRVRAQLSEQRGGADAIFDAKGNRTDGARLLAVVTIRPGTQGKDLRLPSSRDYEAIWKTQRRLEDDTKKALPRGLSLVPDEEIPITEIRRISVPLYGCTTWADVFTQRQKLSLSILSTKARAVSDGATSPNGKAIADLIALSVSKQAERSSSFVSWITQTQAPRGTFARQALGFVWDFAEVVPICGDQEYLKLIAAMVEVAKRLSVIDRHGQVESSDACNPPLPDQSVQVWFTDPPYYDSVPYAHLSDFFYVWLRRILHHDKRLGFAEVLVPKDQECVVDRPHRLNPTAKDESFYEQKMAAAMSAGRRILANDGVGCVVFAHKTTEGWESLIGGMLRGGLVVTASWPVQTERGARLNAQEQAALATSVHLVCRPRPEDAPVGDWADVLRELPKRVGDWMERLQGEGIRGADLVFACIGPALEIFSRYRSVETADGHEVKLGEYLEKVWETVSRMALEQILGTSDAKARNGMAGAIEEDARLTALFLWTLQSTNGETSNGDAEAENEQDQDATTRGKPKGLSLAFDIVRRFAQPLGIDLPKWEGRIVETQKGVVRLMTVSERAKQLFGEDGADAVADWITEDPTRPLQQMLFPELEKDRAPKIRGRGRRRKAIMDTSDVELQKDRDATTMDRVHAAMLLQAGGQANALRALIKAEQDRGPDFLRLANALSALYPKGSEEKRLLDAMLLAVPR